MVSEPHQTRVTISPGVSDRACRVRRVSPEIAILVAMDYRRVTQALHAALTMRALCRALSHPDWDILRLRWRHRSRRIDGDSPPVIFMRDSSRRQAGVRRACCRRYTKALCRQIADCKHLSWSGSAPLENGNSRRASDAAFRMKSSDNMLP